MIWLQLVLRSVDVGLALATWYPNTVCYVITTTYVLFVAFLAIGLHFTGLSQEDLKRHRNGAYLLVLFIIMVAGMLHNGYYILAAIYTAARLHLEILCRRDYALYCRTKNK